MEKTDRLFLMMEDPGQYTAEEWQEALADDECRQLYSIMAATQSAVCAEKADELTDEEMEAEWLRLAAKPRRSWLRKAAMFIGVVLLSGMAIAAIHVIHHSQRQQQQAADTTATAEISRRALPASHEKADSLLPTGKDPVIFNNVEMEQIMQYVGKAFGVSIHFQKEEARHLRFYLQLETGDTLQDIIEKLNHFEQVHLTLREETITIE